MSLAGHVRLTCAAGPEGRSYLSAQSFSAPIHLSKPHHDAGMLVVNLVNPTAGWLAGDFLESAITVEPGARLLLTAPSASRAHRMPEASRSFAKGEPLEGAECATLVQNFHVRAAGWLESWPEIFIPQAGTCFRQRTSAHVENGGEMLLIEMLAPGRTAMGEVGKFRWLDWETEIFSGTQKVARERFRLAPAEPSWKAMTALFPTPYYASFLVVSPRLSTSHSCWAAIHELHDAHAWIGCGPLVSGGFVIRVLSGGSVILRDRVGRIRRILYDALKREMPSLRRI